MNDNSEVAAGIRTEPSRPARGHAAVERLLLDDLHKATETVALTVAELLTG